MVICDVMEKSMLLDSWRNRTIWGFSTMQHVWTHWNDVVVGYSLLQVFFYNLHHWHWSSFLLYLRLRCIYNKKCRIVEVWLGFCYLHYSFDNWDSFEIIHFCFSCHKLNGYSKRPGNLFVIHGWLQINQLKRNPIFNVFAFWNQEICEFMCLGAMENAKVYL
jgi:hypothetical protein